MCGLVGMVSKNRNGFNAHNLDVFDTLLFVDQMRGQDSTGVFVVDNIGNVDVAKEAADATVFLRQPGYRDIRQKAIQKGWAMIGHNRKATKGEINDANAHPFWVDEKLVLVHNGTLYGNHKDIKDVEVDSHAIAHLLAEEENEEKALQKVNGAYALIWYNVEKKKLSFIRNDQRPLHWCETHDAWYFSSELGMLEFAMHRTNQNILKEGPYGFGVHSLESWVLQDDKSTKLEAANINAKYLPPVVARPQSAANFQQEKEEQKTTGMVVPFIPKSCAWFGDDELAAYEDGVLCPDSEELKRLRAEGERIGREALEKARAQDAVEPDEPDSLDETALVEVEGGVMRPMGLVSPLPKGQKQYSFKDYEVAQKKYSKQRIRVEVKDYLADDAGLNNVWMTGTTMEGDGFYVVFPVQKSIFDAITHPQSEFALSKKAEFSVEIDTVGWRASKKEGNDMSKWMGNIVLTGKSGRIYASNGHVLQ